MGGAWEQGYINNYTYARCEVSPIQKVARVTGAEIAISGIVRFNTVLTAIVEHTPS